MDKIKVENSMNQGCTHF